MKMLAEVMTYVERLNALRRKVVASVEGVDVAALDWKPLAGDTNSLIVLAVHSLGAEHGWIGEIIGGEPKTRMRPREFEAQSDQVSELRERSAAMARESERVLAELTERDLSRMLEHETYGMVSVRWAILHVIEHYAEHLGQMELTRQLWEKNNL
jgi:uncharacterized damage-inducible protein DinB